MRQTADDRAWHGAAHEAGHAVVAFALGVRLTHIRIRDGANEFSEVGFVAADRCTITPLDNAAIDAAGTIGGVMLFPRFRDLRKKPPPMPFQTDEQSMLLMKRLHERLTGQVETVDQFHRAAAALAVDLLQQNEVALSKLAQLALCHRYLGAQVIHTALAASVFSFGDSA